VKSAKSAIKPYYVGKKINKEEYKYIMKKVVCKTIEYIKEHRFKKLMMIKLAN
jgi:hypothetical protein